MIRLNILLVFVSVLSLSTFAQAHRSKKDASHNHVTLAPEVYELTYFPDTSNSIINVIITVKHSHGSKSSWIGFGTNSAPAMAGADIAVGGFHEGKPFLENHKGVGNTLGSSSDNTWTLQNDQSTQNDTHLQLHLQTTPKKSNTWIIYAFGDGDKPKYHGQSRGAKEISLMSSGSSSRTTETPKSSSTVVPTTPATPNARTTPAPDSPGGASGIFHTNQSPLFYLMFTCVVLFTKQLF